MKKTGMLNRDIARVLASLGHTDTIVIADCGLPIPLGVECIDLSIRRGTPTFSDVLEEVLKDMEVEAMVCANEVKEKNAAVHHILQNKRVPIEYVSHEMLKAETQKAKAVIRTGERTPYANAVLRAGVIF